MKVLHSVCQQIWRTQYWPQDWKISVFIPFPKKGNAKECSNYCTIALTSHASKVMLKSSKPGFNSRWTVNFQIQAGFGKDRGTRDQIANIHWITEKVREFQKNTCFMTTPKPLTVWLTRNCGTFLKRWEYQTTLPASWEICMQVKKQQLEPDIEKQTDSKSRKEYIKTVYCHPAYLTYMQSTSCEMPGWNQDCWEKYQ